MYSSLFFASPQGAGYVPLFLINGTRTHDPDLGLIRQLAFQILDPAFSRIELPFGLSSEVFCWAIDFFSDPTHSTARGIEAIKFLAPKAYAPNKKPSKIFKAVCDALKVSDNTAGSEFQRLYAQFADELTTKKIEFKLYVSINPAHFLTMSNPKDDTRGSTLTSCHSLNSTEYEYNVGCTGYARDRWSFIVFTVSDPTKPETLNNRKTNRQIFAYKPGNGLLLQSRLYNTNGGTTGAQKDSALYRDLIQRELSELEGVPNLWKTYAYLGGKESCVEMGEGFGGYTDWIYADFDAKVSIRADMEDDYDPLVVGTYGLCVECAEVVNSGLYCLNCSDNSSYCAWCGGRFSEAHPVHNCDDEEEYVCESCREEFFCYCGRCGEYYPAGNMREIDGLHVCDTCFEEDYEYCPECESYVLNGRMREAYNSSGDTVYVCSDCRDSYYTKCEHCGRYVLDDTTFDAHDAHGNNIIICADCQTEHFARCDVEVVA